MPGFKVNEEMVTQINWYYVTGELRYRQIADKLNIAVSTVCTYLTRDSKENVKVARAKALKNRKKEIYNLCNVELKTYKEVAKIYNISYDAARKYAQYDVGVCKNATNGNNM